MAGITSNPVINFSVSPADIAATIAGRRDLIIGQLGDSATAVSGDLYLNVETMTDDEIRTLFGEDVDLTYKILEFRSGNNRQSQLDVIGISNSGGTAAASTITVTGTATAEGTLKISVVDAVKFTVNVTIADGTSNTDAAAAINTALDALTRPVFSTGVASNVVTLTAKDKGTIGNYYGVRITGNVPGLTIALTAFTGGATDPTLTDILDPIEGIRYTGLQWPEQWFSQISIPKTEFDSRFNSMYAIMDGVIFTGHSDTYANDISAVTSLNSSSLVVMGNNKVNLDLHKGPAILTPADWVASFAMGALSRRITDGALVSDIVISKAPGDLIGGIHNASLPIFNTPLPNVEVTQATNLFSPAEQSELLDEGFATFGVNSANTSMLLGQIVTTYKTDTAGNLNTSFKYLNYVYTASVAREYMFNNMKSDFSQSRLTNGDLKPNYSNNNQASISAKFLTYYKELSEVQVTQAGSEAERHFKQNLLLEIDFTTGTVTVSGKWLIVVQMRTINANFAMAFNLPT